MQTQSLNELPSAPVRVPAGFWSRFAAAFIDGIILLLAILPMNLALQLYTSSVQSSSSDEASMGVIIASILYFLLTTSISWLYPAWFYATKGATPGKKVMGIEVVDMMTGGHPGYGQTFMREIVGKTVSVIVFMVGYLMPIFRADKRALHDLMAQTAVVRSARPAPAVQL